MKISRSRRFNISVAPYETYSFSAGVTMDHHDLGVSDEALERLPLKDRKALAKRVTAAILTELDVQMEQELAEAQDMAMEDSFIRQYTWEED